MDFKTKSITVSAKKWRKNEEEIETPDGPMNVWKGDWVVTTSNGNIAILGNEIFKELFQRQEK